MQRDAVGDGKRNQLTNYGLDRCAKNSDEITLIYYTVLYLYEIAVFKRTELYQCRDCGFTLDFSPDFDFFLTPHI